MNTSVLRLLSLIPFSNKRDESALEKWLVLGQGGYKKSLKHPSKRKQCSPMIAATFVLGNRLLLLQGWVPVAGGIQAKGMSQEEGIWEAQWGQVISQIFTISKMLVYNYVFVNTAQSHWCGEEGRVCLVQPFLSCPPASVNAGGAGAEWHGSPTLTLLRCTPPFPDQMLQAHIMICEQTSQPRDWTTSFCFSAKGHEPQAGTGE